MMVNGGGGSSTGGDNKVTTWCTVMLTGVVGSITKKFRDYTKGLKNMTIKLTSSPVVTLSMPENLGETNKRKLGMTSSVTRDDTTKKVKIYVDEDLMIECEMINLMTKPGQEMCT